MRGLIDKKKRGAAHFEMIFSFVFFVGFVFFLFLFLKPEDTTTLSGAVIAGLYDSFEEEVYTNLTNMFLKAEYVGDGTDDKNCFIIELPGHIFTYALNTGESYVTTLAGDDVNSDLTNSGNGGNLKINNVSSFFRVAISPEFTDGTLTNCEGLDNYELGNVVERRVVSKSSLDAMADEYLHDYEGLRTKLKVPPVFDFAIVIENMTLANNMEPEFGVPSSVEVMAQDYIVAVLDSDGKLTNERVTLKIW